MALDLIQQWKKQEIWNPFHKQNYLISDFQTLNAQAARTALSSNLHQFCKPKFSCFMRETEFSFFLEYLMLIIAKF